MSTTLEEQHTAVPQDTQNQQQPPQSDNRHSTITLVVGPEQRTFEIQEELICTRCPFFFNAFSGNFLEATTKVISFPDDEPDRFMELQTWLEDESIPSQRQSWIALSKIWLFADKYYIDSLQNCAIDALAQKFAVHEEGINISFETLDYVVENAYTRSPLRRLFADMLTNGISLQQLPSRMDQIPTEFLQDMCLAFKSTTSINGPTNVSLLTNPIGTYYTVSNTCKTNAMPKRSDRSVEPIDLDCDGHACRPKGAGEPIRELMYICTNHNIKLCERCRYSHRGHRKKAISLTSRSTEITSLVLLQLSVGK